MRPVRDLLHSHNTRRDVAKWQDKLRSDQPSAPVAQLGVLALNLQRNAITDRGVHELAEALADDKWLLEIDLSANPIGAGAVGDLVDVLDTNAALSVVRIDDIACRDALLIDRLVRRLVERADRKVGGGATRRRSLRAQCRILNPAAARDTIADGDPARVAIETGLESAQGKVAVAVDEADQPVGV